VPTDPLTAPLLGLRDPAVISKRGKLVECRAVGISAQHRLENTEEDPSQRSPQLAESGCPGASRGGASPAKAAALSRVTVERHLPGAESGRFGGSEGNVDLRATSAGLQRRFLRFVTVVIHWWQRGKQKQAQPAQQQEDW